MGLWQQKVPDLLRSALAGVQTYYTLIDSQTNGVCVLIGRYCDKVEPTLSNMHKFSFNVCLVKQCGVKIWLTYEQYVRLDCIVYHSYFSRKGRYHCSLVIYISHQLKDFQFNYLLIPVTSSNCTCPSFPTGVIWTVFVTKIWWFLDVGWHNLFQQWMPNYDLNIVKPP